VRGLNIVLSICMGLSFAIDKTSWGGMGGVKFFCIHNKSQCFF